MASESSYRINITSEPDKKIEAMALSYDDFVNSYQKNENRKQPPSALMHAALNTLDYSKLESTILIHLDFLDGVKSSVEIDQNKKKYPTGVGFIRDCSEAKKLEDRLSPDDPIIIGNNFLLRALGAVRGIDQVLIHKYDTEHYDTYQNARIKLQLYVRELILEIAANEKDMDNKILNAMHRNFNLKLSAILHETNLNNDLEVPLQHAKLLAHYRDMSSVLDPAKTMITVRKEFINNIETLFTETSHPITKKTPEQINQLDVMTSIKMIPKKIEKEESINDDLRLTYADDESEEINSEEEQANIHAEDKTKSEFKVEEKVTGRNYHAAKPVAFQIVDEAFVSFIKKDDRRLPAQTRYTVAPSVKNGYVVHNEIELKKDGVSIGKSDNWSLRAATMGYIGAGETPSRLFEYAKENLKQLMQAAKRFIPANINKFNFSMLLTDTSWGKQDKMIKSTRDAIQALTAENHAIQYSYLPTNILGTPQSMTLSDFVIEAAKKLNVNPPSTSSDLIDKKARIEKVSQVINILTNSNEVINISACASGQDRTGSVQEVAAGIWETQEIEKHLKNYHEILKQAQDPAGLILFDRTYQKTISSLPHDIMMSRALGCNNAILATLSTPGSTGMKNDSRPDNYFPEIVNKYFYRKTAKTNKAPPIDEEQVKHLYFPPIDKASLQQTYETSLKTISETHDPQTILNALSVWAETALRYQQLKEPKIFRDKISDSFAKTLRFGLFGGSEKEKARSMRSIATEMVAYLRDQKVLTKPTDISEMISSLYKWRDDNIKKYPKDVKHGTVIRHLFELSHVAALQLGVQVYNRPRSS
jgi:hypothetical protein